MGTLRAFAVVISVVSGEESLGYMLIELIARAVRLGLEHKPHSFWETSSYKGTDTWFLARETDN